MKKFQSSISKSPLVPTNTIQKFLKNQNNSLMLSRKSKKSFKSFSGEIIDFLLSTFLSSMHAWPDLPLLKTTIFNKYNQKLPNIYVMTKWMANNYIFITIYLAFNYWKPFSKYILKAILTCRFYFENGF